MFTYQEVEAVLRTAKSTKATYLKQEVLATLSKMEAAKARLAKELQAKKEERAQKEAKTSIKKPSIKKPSGKE